MKKIIIIIAALLCYTFSSAQSKDTIISPAAIDFFPPPKDSIVDNIATVQVKPTFTEDVEKYIKDNLKYPDSALKNNIQGTVYLSFIIEKNGLISNIRIHRSSNKIFDREAIRVISLMPRWTPGRQNGEIVRVSNVLRVTFKP